MKKSEFSRELESRLSDMKPDEIESSINACIKSIDKKMNIKNKKYILKILNIIIYNISIMMILIYRN